MSKDIPKRDEREYTLEDAREQGTTLTKLRVGCSAWRWQQYILPWDKIQWDKMDR